MQCSNDSTLSLEKHLTSANTDRGYLCSSVTITEANKGAFRFVMPLFMPYAMESERLWGI